jgi:hypothetical protein
MASIALWEAPTPSGILAPPTSFLIDGKQYIAVLSGWGGDSAGMQATLNRAFPGQYPPVPEGEIDLGLRVGIAGVVSGFHGRSLADLRS